MRTIVRTLPLVAAAAAALVAAPVRLVGAQGQPQPRQQTIRLEARTIRGDSIIDLVMTRDAAEVKRTIRAWRERESQLFRDLRAARGDDENGQRRLREQLELNAREGFMLMSAIETRCMRERGPRPAGYLGVNMQMLGRENDTMRVIDRAYVTSVEPGSPAERAGLLAQDEIVSIGGLTVDQLAPPALHAQMVPGRTLVARVTRAGAPREFTLTVAPRPAGFGDSCGELEREIASMSIAGPGPMVMEEQGNGGMIRRFFRTPVPVDPRLPREQVTIEIIPQSHSPSAGRFFAGAVFKALDASWREVLGVREGVIVNDVASGSPAAVSGLRGGDVVTLVGRTPVATPLALVQLLNSIEQREAVLTVIRAKERRTVTLKWSDR